METEWPTATEDQLCQECSDKALLTLSTTITGYEKYKHRLGLTDSEIDEIDHDPRTFYSVQGKFHSALKKWKSKSIDSKNPSQSTATYARLVKIADKQNDGTAVRHIHHACVEHSGSRKDVSCRKRTQSDSSEDRPWAKRPQPDYCRGESVERDNVAPKAEALALKPLAPEPLSTAKAHPPTASIQSPTNTTTSLAITAERCSNMKEKVDVLESIFKALARKAFTYFDSHSVKIRTFKGEISCMSVSLRASIFDDLKACFSDLDPQSQIADAWMELSSLWDFLNYELLEHVIQTFIPDNSVKVDLQRYVEATDRFCSITKVHDFFQTWPFRMKKPKEADMRKMVAKTERNWEQCTLQDVKETTNSIAQLLSIPRPFLLVRNVSEGCVSILWYVPPSVAVHVESLVVQPESMTKHMVLSITIDSVQIYPLTPTRQVSLRLQSFYTSKHPAKKLDHLQPFKLALITKEKLFSYNMDTYTKSTLRGDKDDVQFQKSPVTLATLGNLPDGSPARLVLVEGAAGVGKTTFTLEACFKWANRELLNHITMLFLLPSRDFNVQSIKNVDNLVALIAPGDKSIEEELKANDGQGTAFWLDGWDEIPSSLDGQSSFFEKLISSEILPNAVVIVSSRPWATDYIKEQLDKQPSQRIEIVASVHDQIEWLIELKKESSPKRFGMIEAFLKYLDETPAIKGNMHTSLATTITMTVYQWCQESSIDLPTTVTQLYEAYTCCRIHSFLENELQLDPKVWKSNNFIDLCEPYKTWFFSLSQLALNGLENRQQLVFADVTNVLRLQTLGLMQAVVPLYVSEGSAIVSYHFNHLTVQEFLAAIALSHLSDKERSVIIEKCIRNGFFTRVMRFYSGMIKSSTVLRDHMTRMLHSEEEQDKLTVFYWLFEGGDKADIADIIGESKMSIRSDYSWSALDYFVTGYCVARSNSAWSISFFNGNMEDEKMIQFFQTLICCADGERGTARIISLDLSINDLTSQSLRYLPDIPPHLLRNLEYLDVSNNNLDSTGVDYIVKIIPHTPQLEELNLRWNKEIQRGGAVSLISTLVDHKALKDLNLSSTFIAEEDCEQLARLLSSSQCIEQLDVGFNNLSSGSLHILLRGLQQNNSLKFLGLNHSKLGDSGSIVLGKILAGNETLTKVALSDCGISTIGGAALASSLMTNSTLEELIIFQNSLAGGEAAQKFAELIQHNKTLKKLVINSNSLTQSESSALVDSLSNNTTLQRLILPRQHKVNTADKRVLWQ